MYNEGEIPHYQRPFDPSGGMDGETNFGFLAASLLNNISFQKLLDWFDQRTEGVQIVETAARQFNVSRGHVALVFSALFSVYFIFNWRINIFCTTLGLIYPAIKSHKILLIHRAVIDAARANAVIDDNDPNKRVNAPNYLNEIQGEIVFWLRYWIVYSIFSLVAMVVYPFISWFPLLSVIRVAFILYLYHPYTRGTNTIYHLVISPQLKKHQNLIEQFVSAIEKVAMGEIKKFSDKQMKLH